MSSPKVYAVRGAVPRSLVATMPVQFGYAKIAMVPRVARASGPELGLPMFCLALRDVVRVRTAKEFAR